MKDIFSLSSVKFYKHSNKYIHISYFVENFITIFHTNNNVNVSSISLEFINIFCQMIFIYENKQNLQREGAIAATTI